MDPRVLAERRNARPRRCRRYSVLLCLIFAGQAFAVMLLRRFRPYEEQTHSLSVLTTADASSPMASQVADDDAPSPPEPPLKPPLPPPQVPPPSLVDAALPPPDAGRRTMSTPCLVSARGYWTFEVCLQRNVSQFHSFVKGVDRHQLASLGQYNEALGAAGVQRYVGGDPCGEPPRPRECSVWIMCGEHDRIRFVQEPETCKYNISVELKGSTCMGLDEG